MNGFVEAADVSELKDGMMKMVNADGKEILLAKVAGKYYATQNRCNHMGGNLSQGKLQGTIVTCPRHFSQYDLTDGRVIRWTNLSGIMLTLTKIALPPRPLKTYQVQIQGDKVLIEARKVTTAG